MGLIGLSLIVASVVYVIIRPPSWLPPTLLAWLQRSATTSAIADARRRNDDEKDDARQMSSSPPRITPTTIEPPDADRVAMPPPPPPVLTVQPPSIAVEQDEQDESPTTPKATAVQPPSSMPPPPLFSLSTESMPPPPPPRPTPNLSATSSMMLPPALPSRLSAAPRPPTLSQFPATHSAQRARGGPVPDRGPAPPPSSGGGGLAPPPTHTSVPAKPSRQVTLDPGHSPLDWARIAGGAGADLRGLPSSTPYLRVTPSMLRRQTGRRGKDAWMALGGKVYNVTPYAKFHPGGVSELMRGAGRDGTRLFGEVHPWVNYENMLTACLVGILVDEPEPSAAGQPQSEMEAMD